MINVILKAMDNCEAVNTIKKDCAIAASEMTSHLAGLSASSGGVVQKCFEGPAHAQNWDPVHRDHGMCTVDVKNGVKNLFKIVKSFLKLDENCNESNPNACVANGFQIIGALSGTGSFLAGAIGRCSTTGGVVPTAAPRKLAAVGEMGGEYPGVFCAQEVQRLVSQLSKFADRAIDTSIKCSPAPVPPAPPAPVPEVAPPPDETVLETSRLYSREGKQFQFN